MVGRLKAQANEVASETAMIEPVKPADGVAGASTVRHQDDAARCDQHLDDMAPPLKRMGRQNLPAGFLDTAGHLCTHLVMLPI